MPSDRPPEPWSSFFRDLDAACDTAVALHALPGFALAMLYRAPPAPVAAGKQMPRNKTRSFLLLILSALSLTAAAADKTLIDYFLPMPVQGRLAGDVWGAPDVLPRDPRNGLEDVTMKQWCYWDGQIIKGPHNVYHLFASRWDQSQGHRDWFGSLAVHAVSRAPLGPYTDKGLAWPTN